MIAGSIFKCSLVVIVESDHSAAFREVDRVLCMTSLWPMSFEPNSDVPPRSLAEQRSISVLPQFINDCIRCGLTVRARYLRDRLKADDGSASELPQPCQ